MKKPQHLDGVEAFFPGKACHRVCVRGPFQAAPGSKLVQKFQPSHQHHSLAPGRKQELGGGVEKKD